MVIEKKRASRILAIDFGLARFGIAMSDETKLIAMPLPTLTAEKHSGRTVAKLLNYLQKHQEEECYVIEALVFGMPFLMSGKSGLLADEVNHFVELLKKSTEIPIILWDERLTSVQADRSLREGGLTRKKRAQKSDSVAAVIILQNYLDYRINSMQS